MHKIELKIDDDIYDQLMGLLEMLPQDKLELVSTKICSKDSISTKDKVLTHEEKINALLYEERLAHFKFFEDPARIVYTYQSGTPTHAEDFAKLVKILKKNDIKHSTIGIDVLMLEED